MGFRPFVRGPEFTKVGTETEVTIPLKTYVLASLVGMIRAAGIWLIIWLVWCQRNLKIMGFWRWVSREWWPWIAFRWPTVLITFIVCWIGLSAVEYRYRLRIEQVVKHPPQYMPADPADGMWTPLGNRPLFGRRDKPQEAEAEAEMLDINLQTKPKGRSRSQTQRPRILNTKGAREFYRAVAGGSSFAEATANDYGISRRKFNKHIRDPFLARKLADWKNAKHHNLGVYLLDDGERTVEGLSQRQ